MNTKTNGAAFDGPKITPPSASCAEATENQSFFGRMRARVRCYKRDVQAVLENDPAARSLAEVVLTYPGLHAVWGHRVANRLWRDDQHLAARIVAHLNRFYTGVEIHPGATLGRGVFIDHGMGVVIGETAEVGDDCILFKGVVLGGTTNTTGRRHPRLGKRVVVGTNATILGAIEVGDDARVGSGSVVIREVPETSTVVGVPGRIVRGGDRRSRFLQTLDHANMPDPMLEMLRSLHDENVRLRERLKTVEEQLDIEPPTDNDDHLIDPSLATTDLPPQHGG